MTNYPSPQEEGPPIYPRCGEELWWSPSLRDSQLEVGIFACRVCGYMSETMLMSPPKSSPRLSYEEYKIACVSSDCLCCPYCSDSCTSEPQLARHISALHMGTIRKEGCG